MESWFVLLISTSYLGILFVIAWWGDRRSGSVKLIPPGSRRAAIAYALTLAVYNTSWSFYGSVGRSATQGYEFLPIYIGPTLALLLAQPVFLKVISVAKAQNVTSIADFIAARYGKSQTIAALVTLTTLIGVLPYIALQLKAVGTSFDLITAASVGATTAPAQFWADTPFAVAIIMAIFTIIFGVRHIHSTEHHRGLMLAIAFESLVKLAAFLTVGIFIVFGMFNGFGDIFAQPLPVMEKLTSVHLNHPVWYSETLLALIVFFCLPQAFHVMVVENENPRHFRSARLLYPAYLLALSLFMVPIAIAGQSTFGPQINPDTYVINLPLSAGAYGIGLFTFIGGVSAATGMVIIAVVSLSTMLCNDVVMPLLLRNFQLGDKESGDLSQILLRVRRISVIGILLLSYVTYRLVDKGYSLTLIGLLSFVAVAQFGPAFFGGLYWRRANRLATLWGVGAGFFVWFYTLLLPAIASLSPVPSHFMDDGPFGLSWLKPQALFGLSGLDPVSHSTFWSLSINLVIFVALSWFREQSTVERIQAVAFVEGLPGIQASQRSRRAFANLQDMQSLAARFIGGEHSETAFRSYLTTRYRGGPTSSEMDGKADLDALRFTENLVAGAIGAASARIVMASSLQGRTLSRGAAMAMLDEASEALYFNRKLLQATLESVVQGICVVDAEYRIAAWNRRFLDLLDLPGDLVRVGQPFSELVKFNNARGEYGAEDLKAIITNRNMASQSFPYVYERQRPDGTVLEIAYDRMPEGGYVSTYTDVTERYRAARALQDANESLEHRVRERTHDLLEAKAEADQANLSKSRFLAAASHDLLQPLNAARLFVSALNDSLNTTEAGSFVHRKRDQDHARNAVIALRSTEQLIDGLLDISSLDTGIVRAEIENFAVQPLLSRLEIEFSVLAREKGLALKLVPCSGFVKSDPQLLRRVLQNFISNAVRYTDKGRILIGCRKSGQNLRIEVWDTGMGIASDKTAEIFEEFRRLETASHGPDKGLGLGLAIVERIRQILDAKVSVVSKTANQLDTATGHEINCHGTCFSIEVPCGQKMQVVPVVAPLALVEASRGMKILCVDNEPMILEGLVALLEQWGHLPICAKSSLEALQQMELHQFDAILLDYHLSANENGLDFAARLQMNAGFRTPVLLITADRSQSIRSRAQDLGCECIYKPVKPASLRRYLNGQALSRVE